MPLGCACMGNAHDNHDELLTLTEGGSHATYPRTHPDARSRCRHAVVRRFGRGIRRQNQHRPWRALRAAAGGDCHPTAARGGTWDVGLLCPGCLRELVCLQGTLLYRVEWRLVDGPSIQGAMGDDSDRSGAATRPRRAGGILQDSSGTLEEARPAATGWQ